MSLLGYSSVFVVGVSVFAILQARGPVELLDKNDTFFFFALLLPVFFLMVSWMDSDVPRAVPLISCVLSAFLLFQALYYVEGKGTLIENKYQLRYPITATKHKEGVLIELSELKRGFLFFTKAIALGKGKKLAISFNNSEMLRPGEQLKFKAFFAVAPSISDFPFLEAKSVFSYVVPAQH